LHETERGGGPAGSDCRIPGAAAVNELPQVFHPDPDAPPYRPDQTAPFRVKTDFRVEFTNGGHVEARDFLLDIEGESVTAARLAEMVVSALNLLRAGPVTIHRIAVVRRGEHADDEPAREPQRAS
jgi:hypothetical protein